MAHYKRRLMIIVFVGVSFYLFFQFVVEIQDTQRIAVVEHHWRLCNISHDAVLGMFDSRFQTDARPSRSGLNSYHHNSDWRHVSNDKKVFVYSAYTDDGYIRVFGAKLKDTSSSSAVLPLFCRIWYQDGNGEFSMSTVTAKSRDIQENHSKMYTAAVFTCPLTRPQHPIAVSLVFYDDLTCDGPVLPVLSARQPASKARRFSVCTSPLGEWFTYENELVEWLELNQLLGVDFFSFYDYSINKNIKKVLSFYSDRGIVEILPWHIPITEEKIHSKGQLASLNDCLFRNRYKTEFLAFLDPDEIIMPRRTDDKTWSDLLRGLPTEKPPIYKMFSGVDDTAAYQFQNVFFKSLKRSDESKGSHSKGTLFTTKNYLRDTYVFPPNERSKLIVYPEKVDIMGIHNVWEHKKGKTRVVPKKNGLLYHYRFLSDVDKAKNLTKDVTALKYQNALRKRMKENMDWIVIEPAHDKTLN